MTHSHPCRRPQPPHTMIRWIIVFCAMCVFGATLSVSRPASAAPMTLPMDHLAPLLAAATPHGRIDAARTLTPEIVLPLRDKAGLDDLIHRLYDPKDPLYGHYLKPSEFTERFGPSVADVSAITTWAQSKGLHVMSISPNRTLVKVSGPARTVEAAFGVQVNTYTDADGRSIYAPDRAVTVPAEISSRVLNVLGLDNAPKGKPALEKARVRTPSVTDANPLALYASGIGGLSPADVHSIYNIPSGSSYNGSGVTLGLYEEDGFYQSDISTYESQYTGGNVTVTPVSVDGFSTNPTSNAIVPEVTLDIDMLLAMAPSASQIIVYESPGSQGFQTDIVDTFTAMANADAASIISVSYGLSEDIFSSADLDSTYNAAAQMVSQGQELCVCTQDDGAYVDQGSGVGPNVSFPGSLPLVTAVGGTDLTDSSSATWVSETCWYDPSDMQRGPHGTGGGGGISNVWGIPSWQSPVVPPDSYISTTYRNMPDVCLYGDFDTGGYSIYLTSVGGGSGWAGYNGTSAACPLWAGFLAVVDQQRNQHGFGYLGFANPALYALGANAAPYGRDYHDIADNSNNGFYHALTGYDDATGLGTINDGAALLDDLITTNGYSVGNDNFANATTISADPTDPATVYGTNVNAGFESGEPGNTQGSGGASVWWKWTAPASGTATLSTAGSDFQTSVGVYVGSAVNALSQVTSNDGRSAFSFSVYAGGTYYISVDGDEINFPPNYPADEGFITLNLSEVAPPPGNDAFANAYAITASPAHSGTGVGTNYGATFESGEPLNTTSGTGSGGHTAWWKWTAPGTGTATIDTVGSSYDTTLGVYTGSAVNSLTQIAANDDIGGGVLQSRVTFSATSGTTYYISVDGYYTREGNITLNVAETGVSAPGNDNFVNRYTISAGPGAPGTATGNNAAATQESGEPLNTTTGAGSGGHSVWWTWTAPVSTSVTIDTLGSNYDTTLGVYTGSAVNSLTLIASDDDSGDTVQSSVTFDAVAGTTYQISVDGYSYQEGLVTLHVTQAYPTPTITSFTPTSGTVGTAVTITGTHFSGATSVKFNGTTASFSVHSDTQITATVPSGATTGTITVTNPSATATSGSNFTVTNAPPTITGFSPTSGHVGTAVTITGTNFTGATVVGFQNAHATSFTVVSSTTITTSVPSGAVTGPVAVATPGGTAHSSATFTVTTASVPTITSFTPTSGPIGTSVTVTGTNFTGATAVKVNTTTATTFHVVSATSITVTVPTGATTGKISVTTPGGTATSAATFTVTTSTVPTITGFSPTSGVIGTNVTITGTNLTGATVVGFTNAHATSFTVVSSTEITTTVPSGAVTGPVAVATPGGTAHSSASFTVTTSAVPTITSFTPTSGPIGTSVTVTGTNFTGATAVKVNATTATTFHVVSATSITVTVPTGATTGKISVTTPGGTATSSATYTVTASGVPTITSFSPTSGVIGTNVTITGTNLTGASVVGFQNAHATSFTVNGAGTQITTFVPYGAVTGPVAVATPGGTAHSSASFTVTSGTAIPHITSFTPASGAAGTAVTITGVGFTGTTVVGFQNAHATSFTVNSSGTQITTTVPTGAVTGLLAVLAPGGGGQVGDQLHRPLSGGEASKNRAASTMLAARFSVLTRNTAPVLIRMGMFGVITKEGAFDVAAIYRACAQSRLPCPGRGR